MSWSEVGLRVSAESTDAGSWVVAVCAYELWPQPEEQVTVRLAKSWQTQAEAEAHVARIRAALRGEP